MSTIPLEDLPREQALFNHLIDELKRCSIMSAKVQKACEAPSTSHWRTTHWFWGKVELVLQLDQQRQNRLEFDKQFKLKPADDYVGLHRILQKVNGSISWSNQLTGVVETYIW